MLTFGPVGLSNRLLPALKRFSSRGAGRAKVLNVISWASLDASPFVGFYAAAKAALLRLTQAQNLELARFHVDAVAVVPGPKPTPRSTTGTPSAPAVSRAGSAVSARKSVTLSAR